MEVVDITNYGSSLESKRLSVVVVQPYVPKYRESFFVELIGVLDDYGIDCSVAAAVPDKDQAARGDAINAEWILPYVPRNLKIAGKTVGLGGARNLWAAADGVIIGHLGSSLDTYMAIFDAKMRHKKVGLWGHIKSYVSAGNPVDLALEKWQLRQADHVFAYSPGGRDYALASGVIPGRVTTVMNATDTTGLVQAREALTEDEVGRFMQTYGLVSGRALGFIGGLDSSKRIDFLVAALDLLWQSDPDVRVLVAGKGVQAGLLAAAVARGQVVMLGYVDSRGQAMIGRIVSALVIPGRIGLVAVDALVLGVPILTTSWKYHAPEAEFLCEGESRYTSADNVDHYVSLIRYFLKSQTLQKTPISACAWNYPTRHSMVSNFSMGVVKMLRQSD